MWLEIAFEESKAANFGISGLLRLVIRGHGNLAPGTWGNERSDSASPMNSRLLRLFFRN